MKVAFFLDGFGNRRHYYQCVALREAGFDAFILTFKDGKRGYIYHQGLVEEFCVLLPYSQRDFKKSFSLSKAFFLHSFLKSQKIGIVFTHRFKLLRYLIFSKQLNPYLKLVLHHVIPQEFSTSLYRRLFLKFFNSFIDKILTNSLGLKEELKRDCFLPEHRIGLLYSGIDLEEFKLSLSPQEARSQLTLPEKEFLFGIIAHFRPEKDHISLLQAFRIYKNKGLPGKLVLVGEGPLLETCQKLTRELNLEGEIIFLGRLPATQIPIFLRSLDVFVFTSLREGMPLSVLEAMASGLPIIATDAQGIPDLFQSPLNFGRMVPKAQPQALAQAMEELFYLPAEERQILGENAKKRIKEDFSIEKLKINTVNLIKEVLSS